MSLLVTREPWLAFDPADVINGEVGVSLVNGLLVGGLLLGAFANGTVGDDAGLDASEVAGLPAVMVGFDNKCGFGGGATGKKGCCREGKEKAFHRSVLLCGLTQHSTLRGAWQEGV